MTFRLSTEQFAYHDIEMRRIVEPGMIRLFVGRSSVDLPLTAEIALVGPTFALVERHDYVTRTAVD